MSGGRKRSPSPRRDRSRSRDKDGDKDRDRVRDRDRDRDRDRERKHRKKRDVSRSTSRSPPKRREERRRRKSRSMSPASSPPPPPPPPPPPQDERRQRQKRSQSKERERRERNQKMYESKDERVKREAVEEENRRKRNRDDDEGARGEDERKEGDGEGEGEVPEDKQGPDFKTSGKLLEDTNVFNGVVIKYSEPPEAKKPKKRWRFYVFKGEESMPTLHIHRQSAFLMGKDRKIVDIPIDHPSCSRQHAVLQYKLMQKHGMSKVLPYVIDLGSSNGTYLNNKRIDPQRYYELREKDMLKFGYSSREYVLLHDASQDNRDPPTPTD